jgi:ATP-dependent RNA helicase DeaD
VSVLLVPYTRRRRAEQLLYAAGLRATWSPPPSADEIGARDSERLLRDVVPAGEEILAEDLAAARALLAERSPEQVAAALLRLHRASLPAPEELFDGRPTMTEAVPRERERRPRREGTDGGAGGRSGGGGDDAAWFRMNIGRTRNADPRWLIPLICRRGHVTKQEIGAIRISERETRFEIARHAAERFAVAAGRPDIEDASVRIEPLRGDRPPPPAAAQRERHPRAPAARRA